MLTIKVGKKYEQNDWCNDHYLMVHDSDEPSHDWPVDSWTTTELSIDVALATGMVGRRDDGSLYLRGYVTCKDVVEEVTTMLTFYCDDKGAIHPDHVANRQRIIDRYGLDDELASLTDWEWCWLDWQIRGQAQDMILGDMDTSAAEFRIDVRTLFDANLRGIISDKQTGKIMQGTA